MRRWMQECAVLLGLLVCASPLSAQSVQQSGSVTPGHAAKWTTTGVISDGGTASNGLLTSLGVTASGPGICQQSGPNTGALNRVCLNATSTGGGISMNNVGGATGGFTFTLNGVTQGIATVTLPVTVGDAACFADISGTLNDCGLNPGTFVVGPASAVANNVATFNGTTGKIIKDSGYPVVPRTVKYLKDPAFGYVADGVTDNRAAWNAAIVYANANSGKISFIVPCGTGLVAGTASLTAIIVDQVSFLGECGATGSRINPTGNTSAGLFIWGSGAVQTAEGGFYDVGFDGNGSATQLLFNSINGQRLQFLNINISNVGGFVQAGVSGGTAVNGLTIFNLVGMFANVAVTRINLINGAGAYIQEARVFSNAANVAAVVSGSNFVAAFTKGWDTVRVADSIVELFNFPVYLQATTGVAINNVQITNNYFDSSRAGIAFVADAGGTMYAVQLVNNELTSAAGNCLEFSGAGSNFGHFVVSNRIIQCGNHGIAVGATVAATTFSANQVYGVNQLASSSDAFNVTAGTTDLTFTGNQAGYVTSAPLNGTPRYGFNIGNGTNIFGANNKGNGSTAGCLLGTLTTSRWQNNEGTGCGNTPVYTAVEGGTGFGSYAVGDLLQANTTTTLAKLASVATGNALISGGITTVSSWGKIGLTTHVSGVLAETNGGTNQSIYTTGDLLQASASNTLSKLAAVATGNALISGGVTTASSWGKIGLTTHVSGVLPVANGGTNCSVASGTCLDNITGFGSTGILARTAAGTYAFRTLTGTANRVTITNGDGVSGNPTFDVGSLVPITSSANVFTNVQTISVSGTQGLVTQTTASTGAIANFIQQSNGTGGVILFGVEASPAIGLFSGTSAFAAVFGNTIAARNVEFASANVVQMRLFASGGVSIGSTTDPGVGGFFANGATVTLNGITTDATHTDRTVCQDTTSKSLFFGSGALGICLGTSGRQFKTDFAPMKAGLNEIAQLKLWNYRYKVGHGDDGAHVQYGPTAQDVEAVLPDLVRHDEKGTPINYDYGSLLFIGIHAIQQLKSANDNLKQRLDALERKVAGGKR